MSDVTSTESTGQDLVAVGDQKQYVSITIGDQLFGIPVLLVHDILGPQRITRIPLSPSEVAGSLNLRGRIVTAIEMRLRLKMSGREDGDEGMNVVVEHKGELYSLIVDSVGEVKPTDRVGLTNACGTLLPFNTN